MIRLCVPESLREKVAGFVEHQGLNWELVVEAPCEVRIAVSDGSDRRECTGDTLEAGGWIKCSAAWALGVMYGIPLLQLGAFLDVLDIKVRQCALGCFE
jgi:hypothetical protein